MRSPCTYRIIAARIRCGYLKITLASCFSLLLYVDLCFFYDKVVVTLTILMRCNVTKRLSTVARYKCKQKQKLEIELLKWKLSSTETYVCYQTLMNVRLAMVGVISSALTRSAVTSACANHSTSFTTISATASVSSKLRLSWF